MNIVTDNLQQIIDAPDGIKRLRELILQLAVQGKLVEQRPEEGTAADLLKEIKKAKAADQKQRKANGERVSKTTPLPPISTEEIPFEIPGSWEWVRLGNVFKYGESKKISPDSISDETWVLELEDIEKNTSKILQRHTFEQRKSMSSKATFKAGDVLYGKLRPYLNKAVVADADGVCTTEIVALEQYTGVIPHYTLTVLKSPYFINHVNKLTYGVKMPRLGTNDAKATGLPLPPLPEQKRIVAKVDELMGWCDQLEELKQKREALRKAALKSSLLDLTAQGGKDATTRIFNNFAALIRTPEDVKQMRDAILQLAVQGRLVEQRPEDGTAADLIKEIKQAKAADQKQRKANGERVSKTNPLPPISAEEIPFDIPENWEWVRLGNILKYGESKKVSPDGIPDETWILELEDIEKNTSIILQRHTFEQRKSKSSKTTFKKGDVLYGKLRPYLNKAVVADADGVCTTEIVALEQYTGVIPHYTLTVLKSPYFINHVNELTYGVKMPRLGTNDAKATGFPLPPLPEQKRIVAKVDELMSWCDELDALLTSEADTAMRFAAAVAKGG